MNGESSDDSLRTHSELRDYPDVNVSMVEASTRCARRNVSFTQIDVPRTHERLFLPTVDALGRCCRCRPKFCSMRAAVSLASSATAKTVVTRREWCNSTVMDVGLPGAECQVVSTVVAKSNA